MEEKRGFKSKGTVFNLDCPDQAELYDYAMERSNFSAYVKRLIQADRDAKKRTTGHPVVRNGGGIKIKIGE